MTKKGLALTERINVTTKNVSSNDVRHLNRRVNVEFAKMDNLNITGYKVVARLNPYQGTENYSVRIIASVANGQTFTAAKTGSDNDIHLSELYAEANASLKRTMLREQDKDYTTR